MEVFFKFKYIRGRDVFTIYSNNNAPKYNNQVIVNKNDILFCLNLKDTFRIALNDSEYFYCYRINLEPAK